MADWYGVSRTNTFRVKNLDAFTKAIEHLNVSISSRDKRGIVLLSQSHNGEWPTSYYDEATQDFIEVDWRAIMTTHLHDEDIFIVMESGNEKLRYITGWAMAINSNGDAKRLSLSEIYDIAANAFPGKKITPAEY